MDENGNWVKKDISNYQEPDPNATQIVGNTKMLDDIEFNNTIANRGDNDIFAGDGITIEYTKGIDNTGTMTFSATSDSTGEIKVTGESNKPAIDQRGASSLKNQKASLGLLVNVFADGGEGTLYF